MNSDHCPKYNGISQITVYIPDETILEKDRDYTVTYLNDGMDFTDIQVEFILGGYSILEHYPKSDEIIKFEYNYTPSISQTQAETTHKITDVLFKNKINDQLSIYSEINSTYSFSKTSEYQKDIFTNEQENNKYN